MPCRTLPWCPQSHARAIVARNAALTTLGIAAHQNEAPIVGAPAPAAGRCLGARRRTQRSEYGGRRPRRAKRWAPLLEPAAEPSRIVAVGSKRPIWVETVDSLTARRAIRGAHRHILTRPGHAPATRNFPRGWESHLHGFWVATDVRSGALINMARHSERRSDGYGRVFNTLAACVVAPVLCIGCAGDAGEPPQGAGGLPTIHLGNGGAAAGGNAPGKGWGDAAATGHAGANGAAGNAGAASSNGGASGGGGGVGGNGGSQSAGARGDAAGGPSTPSPSTTSSGREKGICAPSSSRTTQGEAPCN